MTGSAAVVGIGMTSPVGLTASETAASVRAGTARFAATPFRDRLFEPFTLARVPDDGLPHLHDGIADAERLTGRERRLLRLATQPLRECLSPLLATGWSGRLPLFLALPEPTTTLALEPTAFLQRLAAQSGIAIDPERSAATHVGRAGGLVAVGQAVATIVGGHADIVVAGGVDTYADVYVLGTMDDERRVKSATNLDGFIPGEGSAFLLLASDAAAAARGLAPLARVSGVSLAFEAGHLYAEEPYRGDALAAAVGQLAVTGSVESPLAEVFSSMNGESHWAKEWGVAFLRNRALFDSAHGMHHPADSCGDTGAACGPMMIGLAAIGMRANYRRSPALVYGSSDRGLRAAVAVTTPAH